MESIFVSALTSGKNEKVSKREVRISSRDVRVLILNDDFVKVPSSWSAV